ncbi:hypothetical protein GCM10020331_052540 [Ectobacillus funiculus]
MTGSTFTISNLGAYGVEHFTPILNPPEAGILGVGAAYDKPVYKGEELQRRTIMPLSLTFDHRVLDGAPAAAFLQAVKQYLEEPILMLFIGRGDGMTTIAIIGGADLQDMWRQLLPPSRDNMLFSLTRAC